MRHRAPFVALLAGAVLAALIGVPMLMVMVLMGGQADREELCGGRGDLVLASSAAELDEAQLRNAAAIVDQGNRLGVPREGVVIALAVAHQESGFRNYANDGLGRDLAPDQAGIAASMELPHEAVGTDHGSLGVFQQQWPWWGSMPELMDPATAARKFYAALLSLPGWRQMEATEAAQAVQHSDYPDAYADDVPLAIELLGEEDGGMEGLAQNAVYYGGAAGGACSPAAGAPGTVVHPLARSAFYVDQANWGDSGSHWESTHTGTDFSASCGTPVLAATDGVATVKTDEPWSGPWLLQVTTHGGEVTTWYAHMEKLLVADGDRVVAGEQVGAVGTLGNSTGCHLHFEVRPVGAPEGVDPSQWLEENTGRRLGEGPARSQAVDSRSTETVTVLAATVPRALSDGGARRQIRALTAEGPEVLVLHDVRHRDVRAMLPPDSGWGVWQPTGRKGGSAILWRASRFRPTEYGAEFGTRTASGERWMPWVFLQSDDGTLPIVALHMPADESGAASTRPGRTMTANYQRLLAELSSAGYPPVIAGFWHRPLPVPAADWSPVRALRQIGFTISWGGPRCSHGGGRGCLVDGFAFHPEHLQVVSQGRMALSPSGQRPMWVTIAPVG